MSEYHYYEFQAIDRPLTGAQMAALRACSSRATITSTRFVNCYSYGRFKGDERKWMERYFDAFLFQANWGARHLSLRLPAAQLPFREARRYCSGGAAEARRYGRYVILDLNSDDEEGSDWVEEDDGQMASLVPLRGELAGGDLRPLYLAWLARAQADELEPDAKEPPPPPGLGSLTAPQEALVDFLRLDRGLLLAAAAGSPPSLSPVDVGDLRAWVRELPESKKSELLVGLLRGDGERLRSDIVRDIRSAAEAGTGLARRPPRTVASLVEHGERRSWARATGRGRRRLPAEQ